MTSDLSSLQRAEYEIRELRQLAAEQAETIEKIRAVVAGVRVGMGFVGFLNDLRAILDAADREK